MEHLSVWYLAQENLCSILKVFWPLSLPPKVFSEAGLELRTCHFSALLLLLLLLLSISVIYV